jgi:hypothetical protein
MGEPRFRGVDVALRRGLRLLLESMKDVDRISQASRIDRAEGACIISHSNFFDPFADRWHGLEVVGLLAALYAVKLAADIVPRVARELTQALERVAEKSHWLHAVSISVRIYGGKASATG